MTRHFSLEEWLDFTNRNVISDKRVFMQHHLESGCAHCKQIASHWRNLRNFAVQELTVQAPADAVLAMKRAFRANKTTSISLVEVFAKLIFDSFQQPAFAGVRSSMATTRSLLYEAGPLLIDLNLDFAENTGHVVLQGQVMDSQIKGRGVEEIPVSLQSGQETLAKTQTNEFGEFHLECDARKGLQVSVSVNPRRYVTIVLDETVWAPRQSANAH
jgi:hypothetical protein